jgi:hypothetical protein
MRAPGTEHGDGLPQCPSITRTSKFKKDLLELRDQLDKALIFCYKVHSFLKGFDALGTHAFAELQARTERLDFILGS